MIKIKAGNERNSRAIAKFANAEIGYFGLKIRGSLRFKIVGIKAGNARNSKAIAKFSNAEPGYFGLKLIPHVLIRGSPGQFMTSVHLHPEFKVRVKFG
jgi:hypothetical protein